MADLGTIMAVITGTVALMVGIWIVVSVNSSVSLPAYVADNESINFAANTTAYTPSFPYYITIVSLWDDPGHLSECWAKFGPSGTVTPNRITVNTSGFGIKSNSTAGGPSSNCTVNNMSTGVKYVTYTHTDTSANSTFGNVTLVTWNSLTLLAVGLIVLAAGAILAYFGFRKE